MKKNYIYYAIVMIAMLFVASCNPEDLTDEDKQQIQQQADLPWHQSLQQQDPSLDPSPTRGPDKSFRPAD